MTPDQLHILQQVSAQAKYRPSRIRKRVRVRLEDFATRHAARMKARREKIDKYAEPKPQPEKVDTTNMRFIKLSFRAVFEQPLGVLNPMGLKLPGPFPVEVFGDGEKWQARSITSKPTTYDRLTKFSSADNGKYQVETSFARQIEQWQAWGNPPDENEPRLILPEEYAELGNGKYGFRQPVDYTHILHAASIPPGAKVPPAACGADVRAECFISNKANVRPSCQKCAEVWEKHYQEQRA